jgi:hypothetical protein
MKSRRQVDVVTSMKTCFLLMPFRNDLDDVYGSIKKVCTELHVTCWRADEVSRPGNVFGMILGDIKKADVVIADLTGRNPNVFYETAVAHMQKAPQQVILLAQSDRTSRSTFRRCVTSNIRTTNQAARN